MSKANALEQQMLDLINAERAAIGVAPLEFNDRLNDAAEDHSQWMTDDDTFDHTGDGGSTAGERIVDAGYDLEGSWITGENIQATSLRGPDGLADEVVLAHESLMNSPGHRANILDPRFEDIGIGIEDGPLTYNAGTPQQRTLESILVTQNFATSGADNTDAPVPPTEDPAQDQTDVPVAEVDPSDSDDEVVAAPGTGEDAEIEAPVAETPDEDETPVAEVDPSDDDLVTATTEDPVADADPSDGDVVTDTTEDPVADADPSDGDVVAVTTPDPVVEDGGTPVTQADEETTDPVDGTMEQTCDLADFMPDLFQFDLRDFADAGNGFGNGAGFDPSDLDFSAFSLDDLDLGSLDFGGLNGQNNTGGFNGQNNGLNNTGGGTNGQNNGNGNTAGGDGFEFDLSFPDDLFASTSFADLV